MDETPIHGCVENKVTLSRMGSRNVPCLTTKSNLKHISALLAVAFDGTPLPPLLVFEAPPGKTVHRQIQQLDKDNRLYHTVAEKGFCDTEVMIYWAEKVVGPFLKGIVTQLFLIMYSEVFLQ